MSPTPFTFHLNSSSSSVTDIKYNSPAHNSGKVEDGDEIVQINYQTVVGWQYKRVLMQLQESATDVLLTLKKRPKHTKIYGQLGLIKLPSKKRSIPYRWDNLPSPRIEFFNMPDLLMPSSQAIKKEVISDIEDLSGNESDPMTPNDDVNVSDKELRLYMPKPRAAVLQRRHTICGDDLTNFQNIGNLVLWHNRKINRENLESPSLRDKSVSFGFGLELTQRPATLGITDNLTSNRLKTSLPSMKAHGTILEVDEKLENPISTGVKVVRFDSNKSLETAQDSKYLCNVEDTIIESFMPIPYADEEVVIENIEETVVLEPVAKPVPPKPAPRIRANINNEQLAEAVNAVVVNRETVKRGRLDKSHSTPTYDSDQPPAIEPRQQTVKIPPVPPRKNATVVPPKLVHAEAIESNDDNKPRVANVIDLKSTKSVEVPIVVVQSPIKRAPSTNSLTATVQAPVLVEKAKKKPVLEESHDDTETPLKVKTLTNKKKNSLIAKRRKIPLKSLGTSTTIQGHLYRRAKDKTEVAYWAKLYFVLIETALYGFKTKDSVKADCVIYLGGFTVSLAKEVHSKQNAFKVYHPKKTFYLAAETSEALSQWMEYIRLATMKGNTNLDCEPRELFSETECSEDEFDVPTSKQLCTPSPMKSNLDKATNSEQTPPSSKSYHLNFGSLKKFASRKVESATHGYSGENSSPSDHKFLGFFSSNKSAEKKSADIVPTAQFKTYKKVKENNGGLQLGATSMINSTVSDMYLQSGADNTSIQSGFTIDTRKKPEEPIISAEPFHEVFQPKDDFRSHLEVDEDRSVNRHNKKSLNYLHASNPNLLDFNFHSTIDFPSASVTTVNWDRDVQSGMTLLDMMNQQLDDEKKDMYNKRVEQGIEKVDERTMPKKKEKPAVPPKPADPKVEKIQKRSLPITPDYAQSFKPDDKAILYTRTKEGQKLRDFGYELIHGGDDASAMANAKTNEKLWNAKRSDKVVPVSGSLKKKSGFNWITSNEKENPTVTNVLGNSGSFRKSTKKGEFKAANEKFAQLKGQMVLSPAGTTKVLRKNSAPNSGSVIGGIQYFSKLSFSSSSCKEKKLLGSPKLHR